MTGVSLMMTAAEMEAEEGTGPYLPNSTSNDFVAYLAGEGIPPSLGVVAMRSLSFWVPALCIYI